MVMISFSLVLLVLREWVRVLRVMLMMEKLIIGNSCFVSRM